MRPTEPITVFVTHSGPIRLASAPRHVRATDIDVIGVDPLLTLRMAMLGYRVDGGVARKRLERFDRDGQVSGPERVNDLGRLLRVLRDAGYRPMIVERMTVDTKSPALQAAEKRADRRLRGVVRVQSRSTNRSIRQ